MYDAWTAYDGTAIATILGAKLRRPVTERTEANKQRAISYAAYRCLSDLFPTEIAKYNTLMNTLGLDPSDNTLDLREASGVGNLAAASVLEFRHHDGSNQLGDLHVGAYSDYTGYKPLNDPDKISNPDHWQPLRTPVPDGGAYGRFLVQQYLTPQWAMVKPFAMTSGAEFRPASGPQSLQGNKRLYREQAEEILRMSANLTDEQKMIAEYWADGPSSETPPGHWCLFAQFVSLRDHHKLDDDVKMFFALTNALLDASIAAWDAKRTFDSVRPVTAIHYLFVGKQVRAWGGRFKGTQMVPGEQWQPYQAHVMASTPPFPEFVSGHSTFSAAGAEILRAFTGADFFGASTTFAAHVSKIEPGLTPQVPVTLSWVTFTAAAQQAGMSRRYCGIHFADGDLVGRRMGYDVARQTWLKASALFAGRISPLDKMAQTGPL
jgi:hypothetical protein